MATDDRVAVACRSVVRVYGRATEETQALKGIDAEIHRGQLTVVTGPSGSGKSSLLSLVAARDEPSAGWVEVLGVDVGGASPRQLRSLRRTRVSWVPQRASAALFPHLTVLDHLSQAASWRSARVDPRELVARLGLTGCGDRRPAAHSGGEQQRVAVAMAAVGRPEVLVADEPTAELDAEHAEAVLMLLADVAARGGAVVVSSHDPRVVRHADRVLHLRHGVLAEERGSGGSVTFIDSSGRVQLPPEALEAFPDQRAVVRIDDDGVHLTRPDDPS
ncbi:ABC transporter ATP-binding protein [Nocardioides sp.]|uniref:ABC transporter ATP-binding protein n=1 Tax=Nocardioides sp. TaxID=35761 RepID=UPI0035284038